uniref:Uncharacterized protein n=1 Tax=Arundo donax TaxID=35708 RepID=A0A0A9BDQ4_ARUDO
MHMYNILLPFPQKSLANCSTMVFT